MKIFLFLFINLLTLKSFAYTNVFSNILGLGLYNVTYTGKWQDPAPNKTSYIINCNMGYTLCFNNYLTNCQLNFGNNAPNYTTVFIPIQTTNLNLVVPDTFNINYQSYIYTNNTWNPELPLISPNQPFWLYTTNSGVILVLSDDVPVVIDNTLYLSSCNLGLLGMPADRAGRLVTDLEFPVKAGDTIYQYVTNDFVTNYFNGTNWINTEPILNLGDAFFLQRTNDLTWKTWAEIPQFDANPDGDYYILSWPTNTVFKLYASSVYPFVWILQTNKPNLDKNFRYYYRFNPTNYPLKFYRLVH